LFPNTRAKSVVTKDSQFLQIGTITTVGAFVRTRGRSIDVGYRQPTHSYVIYLTTSAVPTTDPIVTAPRVTARNYIMLIERH
jgi:hypothetical protein